MILKNASLMATVGGGLAVGALMFAGPAAAHAGGSHVGAQAGGGMRAVLPSGQVGSKIGMELPLAPIGTAGSGRVQMTPLG
jgi:hypothetical protein